ncbi:MAG TPA: zinc-binding alcohol dehydrogenase [Capsulimonadaceae bacterium]|jgi:threonine dehydrogenase-like Zn-dependent dehydrogenase
MDKSIAFTRHEFAEVVEVPEKGQPGPKELVGRTHFTLISPGTELAWGYTGSSFPSYPGYAAVFEVTAVGDEVKKFAVGDVAFGRGGHSSTQRMHEDMACPVPSGLAADHAVLARLMGVSMTTLSTTTARPGDTVVVTGLGPVGFLAAHMFKRCGYNVVGVDPDQGRRDTAAQSGIARVYASIPLEGEGAINDAALAVDCSGHEQAVLDGCKCVRRRGEVVLVGVPWRKLADLTAHDILHAVFHKYAVLRSGWEWEIPEHTDLFSHSSLHQNYVTALQWLAEGAIPVDALIERWSPSDAQAVYSGLLARTVSSLFQVFDWR